MEDARLSESPLLLGGTIHPGTLGFSRSIVRRLLSRTGFSSSGAGYPLPEASTFVITGPLEVCSVLAANFSYEYYS